MKTMLGGFDGAAARRAANVDAVEARKERRWIIRESLYSQWWDSRFCQSATWAYTLCASEPRLVPAQFCCGSPGSLHFRNLMTHTPGFEETLKDLVVREEKDLQPVNEYLKTHLPRRIFPPRNDACLFQLRRDPGRLHRCSAFPANPSKITSRSTF